MNEDNLTDSLEFKWFLPMNQDQEGLVKRFLSAMQEKLPMALPTKFGTYEPLRDRTGPTDHSKFMKAWRKHGGPKSLWITKHGDSFYWLSTLPCSGGSVFFGDRSPDKYLHCDRLTISFDAKVVSQNIASVEKIVDLFSEVATVTNAFYASAVIFRNVIITEEATMVPIDGGEYYQLTSGKWWFGLPLIPTWLAWFGGNYTSEVSELFEHPMATKFNSGLLLRAGEKPLNRDDYKAYSHNCQTGYSSSTLRNPERFGLPTTIQRQ